MTLTSIEATTLPDLWFQALYGILDKGKLVEIAEGSFKGIHRLEYPYFTGHVTKPWIRPHYPEIPEHMNIPAPVTSKFLYGNEDGSSHDNLDFSRSIGTPIYGTPVFGGYTGRFCGMLLDIPAEDEDYTYGDRLHGEIEGTTQVAVAIEKLKNVIKSKGSSNQIILQVSNREDILKNDPPCLRHIDIRVDADKLVFICYFRSWDLWGGMPSNLAAIQALKMKMACEVGLNDGELIVASKGLHLYEHAIPLAETRCNKKLKKG